MKPILILLPMLSLAVASSGADIRIGILGTDTSHTESFAKLLNDPSNPKHIPGGRIVAAWKGGSPDIPMSANRVEGYAKALSETYGAKICRTVDELASQVDAFMILSVDGRPHLEEARQVFRYHKPVFIDKPMAGSLRDAIEIFRLARQSNVPCFTASGERYTSDIDEIHQTKFGKLRGVFTYGPAEIEPHHPDLFWYGIHAVEKAYAIMGTGCETVVRTYTPDADVVTGVWSDGRVATVRGNRNTRYAFGVTVFGSEAVLEPKAGDGYEGLIRHIIEFYQTGVPPVSHAETIESLAFMEAADLSKTRGGIPVSVPNLIKANGGLDGI